MMELLKFRRLIVGDLFIFFMLLFLSFSACKKDEEKSVPFDSDEQTSFQSEETIENSVSALESITNAAIKEAEAYTSGRKASTNPEIACATVTFDEGTTAESGGIQIDFGTTGCTGPDGKTRKGIVKVDYVGSWLSYGSTVSTTLTDFYIDGIKIEGTRNSENVGVDASKITFDVEIVGGKVTWPDQTYATREMDRTHTWSFSNNYTEFTLKIEGTASGKNRDGVEYATEITEPLNFTSACLGDYVYLPINGKTTITITGKYKIYVDYGSGDCDSKFTVTIGNKKNEVSLE